MPFTSRMILLDSNGSLKQGAVFFVYRVYHSYKIKFTRVLTSATSYDIIQLAMEKLEMLQLRLEGLPYQTIADRAGISRQRVQQLLSPPTAVRHFVVEKYAGNCNKCGIYVGKSGHVHHTGNLGLENYNDLDNLELLCLGCHRREHIKEPLSMPAPIDRGPELLEKVKTIQKDRGLNDTQVSQLLGYENRAGWARIKGGVVPANEVFQMRAVQAFPELATAPSNKSKGIGSTIKDIYLKVKKFV